MKITIQKIGNVATPTPDMLKEWDKLSDATYTVDIKNLDMRTVAQNNALHLWCNQIAETLNNAGLLATGVFKKDIEWTMIMVKEMIVRPTITTAFQKTSTTKLHKKEIDSMIDIITRAFGTKGVEIPPFPSRMLWD